MRPPGWLQRSGSRLLSRIGLTRKHHWQRVAHRAEQLEAEVHRLRAALQAPPPPPGNDGRPTRRDLLDRLDQHKHQLALALQELEFRTARWRECAEGRAGADPFYDYGFAAVPLSPSPAGSFATVDKQARARPFISGLTARQAYHLEALCLTRLQAQPGAGAAHFPAPVAFDRDAHRITMTHQGSSLDRIPVTERAASGQLIGDYHDQVALMIETMKAARVVHLDLNVAGGNVALAACGRLSLIDFDVATIDDVAFSAKIAMHHAEWRSGGAWEQTRVKLTRIVEEFLEAGQ